MAMPKEMFPNCCSDCADQRTSGSRTGKLAALILRRALHAGPNPHGVWAGFIHGVVTITAPFFPQGRVEEALCWRSKQKNGSGEVLRCSLTLGVVEDP